MPFKCGPKNKKSKKKSIAFWYLLGIYNYNTISIFFLFEYFFFFYLSLIFICLFLDHTHCD